MVMNSTTEVTIIRLCNMRKRSFNFKESKKGLQDQSDGGSHENSDVQPQLQSSMASANMLSPISQRSDRPLHMRLQRDELKFFL
jgi:hypothetical protein